MMEKRFLDPPLCLLCLAAAQAITRAIHSLSWLGELHVKAGCFNSSRRVARLAGAPSFHVNRPLVLFSLYRSLLGIERKEA